MQITRSKAESWLKKIKAKLEDIPGASRCIEELQGFLAQVDWDSGRDESASKGDFPVPEIPMIGETLLFGFSDGACRGNPGPGGWGAMGQDTSGKVLFEASGFEVHTTNNQMELMGAIEALKQLSECAIERGHHPKNTDLKIVLYSDSKYVVDGIMKWVPGWKLRGWKKADNKTPENLQLWKQLEQLQNEFSHISFKWVKGHSGHPQNEHCDQLANSAIDSSGLL